MQHLQFLLALACLAPLAFSWPHAFDASLRIVDSVRQGLQLPLQKRAGPDDDELDPERYDGPLAAMFKKSLEVIYRTQGIGMPSDCVLDCLTRHTVDLTFTPHLGPVSADGYRAFLKEWEVGCKKLCGEDPNGPASPASPTVGQTPARAKKAFGDYNFHFRRLPAALQPGRAARAAKAASHRLGALLGGWQRSPAPGRAVRNAAMELSLP
ncbi:MAG: hypothetical protein M1826_004665 [Phylliscum demangeonii]|nr:MAG: hypothetical protein M1826_004665 [Phylliscum demangeonii]